MAGPRMSQQDGNRSALIKATNLQIGTSERLCRFRSFSPRAVLTTEKGFTEVKFHATLGIESLNLCCSQQPV